MSVTNEIIKELKDYVKSNFDQVREALNIREKLLMRQIDVIASQSQSNPALAEGIKFIPNDEIDLLNYIRSFGKFNVDNINFTNDDLYMNEDYICPSVDHETMYKCLEGKDEVDDMPSDNPEQIVVKFSNNKSLIKENVDTLNDSIINITLKEVKELIERNQINVPKCPGKTQVSQASQTETKNIHKCTKPNITINNCNGTINLKNISNLTINCTGRDLSKNDQLNDCVSSDNNCRKSKEKYNSAENKVSDTLSDSAENIKDNENNSVNCEFYNRLLAEIKNTLKQQTDSNIPSNSSMSDSLSNDSFNRKTLLKNFENLKIVLENNENETHPIQIEQWLTEIISDTEIEPVQNIEILEHSRISNGELL